MCVATMPVSWRYAVRSSIVEKTGITEDVMDLFMQLDGMGCVLQFVRSGRIAVTKSRVERLDQYLTQREMER